MNLIFVLWRNQLHVYLRYKQSFFFKYVGKVICQYLVTYLKLMYELLIWEYSLKNVVIKCSEYLFSKLFSSIFYLKV